MDKDKLINTVLAAIATAMGIAAAITSLIGAIEIKDAVALLAVGMASGGVWMLKNSK